LVYARVREPLRLGARVWNRAGVSRSWRNHSAANAAWRRERRTAAARDD